MSNENETSNQVEPEPLGVVDLDVTEKTRSWQAAGIPHATPESDPQARSVYEDLVGYAHEFQRKSGIEPADILPSNVHIVSKEDLREVELLIGASEEAGAVYDPRTDILYIEEPEHYEEAFSRTLFAYRLAHEMGHKLTPGLNGAYNPEDHSFILSEGLADRFARDFIREMFLPRYAPAIAEKIKQTFSGSSTPYNLNGLPMRAEEVLFVDPASSAAQGFSRIIETRIVEQLEAAMGPEAFAEFLRYAKSTDILAPMQTIVNSLGIDTWRSLTHDPAQKPPIEVIQDSASWNA